MGPSQTEILETILLGDFISETATTMRIQNVFSVQSHNIFFIMDYSHVMKKIRNNLNKSGKYYSCKRRFLHNGQGIYLNVEYLSIAYLWDISSNPFSVHHKLTQEHFHLTGESKMRNHLAEDVLNKEMLHLMECYA